MISSCTMKGHAHPSTEIYISEMLKIGRGENRSPDLAQRRGLLALDRAELLDYLVVGLHLVSL